MVEKTSRKIKNSNTRWEIRRKERKYKENHKELILNILIWTAILIYDDFKEITVQAYYETQFVGLERVAWSTVVSKTRNRDVGITCSLTPCVLWRDVSQ